MKKEYSTPIVEKIAFNYRDQVVAASGTTPPAEQGGSSIPVEGYNSSACEIYDGLRQLLEQIYICNWFG